MQTRSLLLTLSLAFHLSGQNTTIRTTVPLVVLPTSVTDRRGKPIDGLTAADFALFDNSRAKPVNVDVVDSGLPRIALVVLVQTSGLSLSALGKIRKVGAMMSEAVAGENGEIALISFDDQVRVLQDFTHNADAVADAFNDLKPSDSDHARMIDAIHSCLAMLANHPGPSRSSILIIGESRDRGSTAKLSDVQASLQRAGVTVYAMHFSVYLTPFTTKPDEYQPGNGNLFTGVTDLVRLGKQNTLEALTRTTGGLDLSFETKSKLEKNLMRLGSDIHNRYLVSFIPDVEKTQTFHKLLIQVKNHPDAVVLTRPGYWTAAQDSAAK
jgi:VWFA-related protein